MRLLVVALASVVGTTQAADLDITVNDECAAYNEASRKRGGWRNHLAASMCESRVRNRENEAREREERLIREQQEHEARLMREQQEHEAKLLREQRENNARQAQVALGDHGNDEMIQMLLKRRQTAMIECKVDLVKDACEKLTRINDLMTEVSGASEQAHVSQPISSSKGSKSPEYRPPATVSQPISSSKGSKSPEYRPPATATLRDLKIRRQEATYKCLDGDQVQCDQAHIIDDLVDDIEGTP